MRSSFTYKKGGSSSTYRTVAADWLKPAGPISMFQPFAYDMAFAVRRMAGDSQVLTISPDGFCVSDKLLALNTSYPKGLCDKLIFGGIRSIKVNRPLRTIEVTNGLVAIFEVVMNPNGKTLEGVIKELTDKGIIAPELVAQDDKKTETEPPLLINAVKPSIPVISVGDRPLKEQLDEVFQYWREILSPSLTNLIEENHYNAEQAEKALDIARNVRIDFFSWDGLGAKDASRFSRLLYHLYIEATGGHIAGIPRRQPGTTLQTEIYYRLGFKPVTKDDKDKDKRVTYEWDSYTRDKEFLSFLKKRFFDESTGKLSHHKYKEKKRIYNGRFGLGRLTFDEILLLEAIFRGEVPLIDGKENLFKMKTNEAVSLVEGKETERDPYSKIIIEMREKFPFFGVYLPMDEVRWCKDVISRKIDLSFKDRIRVERVLKRVILKEIGLLEFNAREIKWIINYILCHILLHQTDYVFHMAKERKSLTFNGKEIQRAIAERLKEINQTGKLFPEEALMIHHDGKIVVSAEHRQALEEPVLQMIVDYMKTNVLSAQNIITAYEKGYESLHKKDSGDVKLVRTEDGTPIVWTEFLSILELYEKGEYPPVLMEDPLWEKFQKT
ncbi:hypothetical protein A2230_06065 [candidate division WOR-1 bacterium RIFOXYA2_FULL_36_21]|uniref:Uncharacterized protein n=1 Tax=candidate division WOR-1 bacterium RIFOXYB2_FULL_36_35 TaxID=1802578 RepID=A0A1F4S4C7_UNCSA|nr:MAG: hypothetical protein A2230_06065 [candidate division WOR-1 bacterium RIFOXYA2_FULL_36_21]OGC14583.1 MAG: hypothetical protein A2290_01895 [candidate division WOR-1 bacterium RIFOXYB2_FULL_36_35]OGC16255.1 MAG: hypothetical protein A2282_01450 [candidate division WOR-1 bacterium RIFOXYA12_FULL_36_13]